MSISRRRLLVAGLLGACGGSRARAAGRGGPRRRLALRNLHTAEQIDVEYFRDGGYVPAALAGINRLLRDFRTGEVHRMDPLLLDHVHEVALSIGVEPVFSVISGVRSAQTNERLRAHGHGVAQHSLHLQGRAMDVRLAGIDCATLSAAAQRLARGGVGYYRASDFVHLDTGAFRTWRG